MQRAGSRDSDSAAQKTAGTRRSSRCQRSRHARRRPSARAAFAFRAQRAPARTGGRHRAAPICAGRSPRHGHRCPPTLPSHALELSFSQPLVVRLTLPRGQARAYDAPPAAASLDIAPPTWRLRRQCPPNRGAAQQRTLPPSRTRHSRLPVPPKPSAMRRLRRRKAHIALWRGKTGCWGAAAAVRAWTRARRGAGWQACGAARSPRAWLPRARGAAARAAYTCFRPNMSLAQV